MTCRRAWSGWLVRPEAVVSSVLAPHCGPASLWFALFLLSWRGVGNVDDELPGPITDSFLPEAQSPGRGLSRSGLLSEIPRSVCEIPRAIPSGHGTVPCSASHVTLAASVKACWARVNKAQGIKRKVCVKQTMQARIEMRRLDTERGLPGPLAMIRRRVVLRVRRPVAGPNARRATVDTLRGWAHTFEQGMQEVPRGSNRGPGAEARGTRPSGTLAGRGRAFDPGPLFFIVTLSESVNSRG